MRVSESSMVIILASVSFALRRCHCDGVRGQVSNSAIDRIPAPFSYHGRRMKCKSLLDYGSVNPLEILRDTACLGAKTLLRSQGSSSQTLSIFIAALRRVRVN